MKTAAVICPARFLDPAAFHNTLQAWGYSIRYYAAYDAFTFDPDDTDLVIVLGGPIGAYELEDHLFTVQRDSQCAQCLPDTVDPRGPKGK